MCLNNGYRYTIQYAPKGQYDSSRSGVGSETRSIIDFLAERFPHSPRETWGERIAQGELLLGIRSNPEAEPVRISSPEQRLHYGDLVVWNRPPWIEPDAPQEFGYLYEFSDIVVAHKPSGLPTLPGGGFYWNSLLFKVQQKHPSATPMHRLGRATSGIVLFSLHKKASRFLTAHWPSFQKVYLGLAQGIADQDQYEITTRIGAVPHPRLGTVHAATPLGKEAHSTARVLRRNPESTLFQIDLHTGRPHQIRIHLASIGYPLVGDPMYQAGGVPKPELPGLPGDGGYWLHAGSLIATHPTSFQVMQWHAPPPPLLSL